MASLSLKYPTPTRTATIRACQSHLPLQNQPAQILHKSPLCLLSLDLNKSITRRRRRRNLYLIKAIEDGKDETTLTNPSSSSSSMTTDSNESGEKKTLEETSKEGDGDVELGVKIREAMKERKSKENFWGGVREEIGEIEWPVFGKVLGITGVVLGVIAGSSVVLLTVNAVLAEVSDKVFAGRGLQDFFG